MKDPRHCNAPRLKLAQLPTPLQPLNRLHSKLGGPKIWVKRDDLTGCALSGNKIRKLEFSLAQAQAEGGEVVITCGGLQSNHCRATALLCAQLGLKCHLVLRGEPDEADGNYLLDQLAGATISCYPSVRYQRDLSDLLSDWREHYQGQGQRAFVIPTGASDAIGVWGYFHASEELASDCAGTEIKPEHIVCATGSGGTQAGLTAGCHYYLPGATVWGINVCDDEAWFMRKVNQDIADWQQRYDLAAPAEAYGIRVIDGYVGPGYAIAEQAIFRTIAELAALEGVILDPVYTGKAFYGLLQELERGRFGDSGDIVFVHTGGIFGVFPQRAGFAELRP